MTVDWVGLAEKIPLGVLGIMSIVVVAVVAVKSNSALGDVAKRMAEALTDRAGSDVAAPETEPAGLHDEAQPDDFPPHR